MLYDVYLDVLAAMFGIDQTLIEKWLRDKNIIADPIPHNLLVMLKTGTPTEKENAINQLKKMYL